jgi:hypothetical protein
MSLLELLHVILNIMLLNLVRAMSCVEGHKRHTYMAFFLCVMHSG